MNRFIKGTVAAALLVGVVGTAEAAEILVSSDISVSTTWTANNTYNMQDQIYVLPGATLTIEAGTVIASDTGVGGSLAITKGAKIMACGTKDDPIIFTSKADVSTWANDGSHPTGKDPKTGTWQALCETWGNVTIMGCGYISEDKVGSNVETCDADNEAPMEGLVPSGPNDTRNLYGGGDDDDDSGVFKYVSLRYGGLNVALNVELNGLSLGAIGRETDIHHVEIMNNVDDGIEIWGGCVNLKNISIWNIGDDSLDIDQGYRGKVQFGLIVQGYACTGTQGSGVGDNAVEVDGAEDSDWQPVTTTTMCNLTVVGNPIGGDGLTAWRDNARVQYRNCIFMDGGESLVRFDNDDGDCGSGYGHNGTLNWADTWTTDWDAAPAHPNDCPSGTYKAQSDGKLAEIKDSVMFRNVSSAAYTEANARGVFAAGNNNVLVGSVMDVDGPVTSITRDAGGPSVVGGTGVWNVVGLDPRPQNDALTSVDTCPCDDDGFFSAVRYRGAFAPNTNWLCGWTASQAYGFTPDDCFISDLGCALKGQRGDPLLDIDSTMVPGSALTLSLTNARPSSIAFLVVGVSRIDIPWKGGTLKPSLNLIFTLGTNAAGNLVIPGALDPSVPSGVTLYMQYVILDPASVRGNALSNAVSATIQ